MRLKFPLGTPVEQTTPGHWRRFGVGIDCHKDMVWACILQPDFVEQTQRAVVAKYGTDPEQLRALHTWLNVQVPPSFRNFLIESTSTYHYPVMLELDDWVPTVINPKLVGSSKRKTDRWDAKMLAHHSMAGTFPAYTPLTWDEYATRQTYRRWLKLHGTLRRNIRALASRFCLFGINPEANYGTAKWERVWSYLCRPLLGPCTDPPAELAEFAGRIRLVPWILQAGANEQFREIQRCREQVGVLWSMLLRATPPGALGLLRSVPHVGEKAAICFLCEVGVDPCRRFRSVRSMVAYAGFDPSKRVSADKVTSHLPTAGNKFLRRCFLQAASGAMLSKSGRLAQFGQTVRGRGGRRGWFWGVNAVGRKLITYCFAVLRNGEPYSEGLVTDGKSQARDPECDPSEDWGLDADSPGGDADPYGGLTAPLSWDGSESAPDGGEERQGPLGDVSRGDTGL